MIEQVREAGVGPIANRTWGGTGPEFTLPWGERTWTLSLDDEAPGLRVSGENSGPLLSLAGVAEVGRWGPNALSGASLAGYERRHDRIEATYTPAGWADLIVRIAWSPRRADGLDMEVQLQALSVGRLRSVEVMVRSRFGAVDVGPNPGPIGRSLAVEPRDRRSAGFSYDGREPDLDALTTLPLPTSPRASIVLGPVRKGQASRYVELVHPQDEARRLRESGPDGEAFRHGLFGHDLEKGVVLRARLRGLWLPSNRARREAAGHLDQFLAEPPPLGT